MSHPVRIQGKDLPGSPSNTHQVAVNSEGALYVVQQHPLAVTISPEILTRRKLFFDYFRRESDDSRDMTVDGSSTAQEFILGSTAGRVRWISKVRFLIEGNNFDLSSSGDFRKWGSVALSPGLTNGIELYVLQSGIRSDVFYDAVKNMGDLFRYQTGYENFVNAIDSQADFLSIDVHMPETVALPIGVDDKLVCKIQDDLVDADFLSFQLLANGFQETTS